MPDHPLFSLARQAEQRSDLLAPVLRMYMNRQHIDARQLAALLHCSVDVLPRLWLCNKPRVEQYEADIGRIADACGVNAEVWAQIIHQFSSCASIVPIVSFIPAPRLRVLGPHFLHHKDPLCQESQCGKEKAR
jgi:hypothetical protein